MASYRREPFAYRREACESNQDLDYICALLELVYSLAISQGKEDLSALRSKCSLDLKYVKAVLEHPNLGLRIKKAHIRLLTGLFVEEPPQLSRLNFPSRNFVLTESKSFDSDSSLPV